MAMANGYSRSPKLLKGAIIQFSAPLLVPIPNIIVFQYNPESMTRTIEPWWAAAETPKAAKAAGTDCPEADTKAVNPLAQPVDPAETLSLKLKLDAADALEEPDSHPVAVVSGVADRIAAIEMLLYPTVDRPSGNLLSSIASTLAGPKADPAPRRTVPVVLFFWGPGRIVPVRITSFSVDETAYSPTLYPIRAEVTLAMKILDATAFGTEDSATIELAKACYTYTRGQKLALATASGANSFESMGLLPF